MEDTTKFKKEEMALMEVAKWLSDDGIDYGLEFNKAGYVAIVTSPAFDGWQEWAEESGTPCDVRLSAIGELVWTANYPE